MLVLERSSVTQALPTCEKQLLSCWNPSWNLWGCFAKSWLFLIWIAIWLYTELSEKPTLPFNIKMVMPLTCHITTVSHFWDPLCLCSKQVLVQNFSYKHEFDLHENEPTAYCKGRMHFHMDGFPWRQPKGNLVIVYWIISIPDSPVSSAVTSAVVLAAAFQLSAASLSFSAALVAVAEVATEPAVAAVVTHLSSFVPLSASVAQSADVDVPVFGEPPAVLVFFLGLPPVSFSLLLAVS